QRKRGPPQRFSAGPDRREWSPHRTLSLHRVPNGVLGFADFLLNLAFSLVDLAVSLKLALAGDFAGGILHGALGLLGGAGDTILVHGLNLPNGECQDNG